MISAVIFDCDGVLVDSEILAHEVEIEVLQSIGLHYDRHEFTQRFMGMSDAAFFAALDEDGKARLGRSIIAEIRGPMNDRLHKAVAERLTEVPGAARRQIGCTRQSCRQFQHAQAFADQVEQDRALAEI